MKGQTKIIAGIKYVYVTAFLALLSAIFYPFVQGGTLDFVVFGMVMLIIGLAGGILVYKAATAGKRRGIYIGIGFGLIAVSLTYILQLSGRQIF